MNRKDIEPPVVSRPFPISAAAWRIAEEEFPIRGGKGLYESVKREREIMERHYEVLHFLIFGLSEKLSSYLDIDGAFFKAGLLLGFRAHRAEAALKRGVLPNIEMPTLAKFIVDDLGYLNEPPSPSERVDMLVNQKGIFTNFQKTEAQVWSSLGKKRFMSNDLRDGLYFGVADMNALIRAQAGADKAT